IEEAKEAAKREGQIQAKIAQEHIVQQVNQAKEELRKQVGKLVISGAERIIMREVDAKANSALLDNLIEEI
ncbi:MAG: F0F1 ATP synthase subunit B, partial [Legionellales bacterium]